MNPDVKALRTRIEKSRVKTRVRCYDCGTSVLVNDVGQMKSCSCGNITVWQHPDGAEIMHRDNNYQILEVIY